MPTRGNSACLAAGLPLPYKYESLLAETLFAQMLRVPAPAHKPVAYGALMVDLCKLLPTFPRSMSACVRECFTRYMTLLAFKPSLRQPPALCGLDLLRLLPLPGSDVPCHCAARPEALALLCCVCPHLYVCSSTIQQATVR